MRTKEEGEKKSYQSNEASFKLEGKLRAGFFVALSVKVLGVDVFSFGFFVGIEATAKLGCSLTSKIPGVPMKSAYDLLV